MPRRSAALLLGALVLAGCSGETTAGPLDYDTSQPLELTQPSQTRDGNVVVRDLSYASGTDRIEAYLVFPAAEGDDLPGVVHLHGSGGDREQMLASAKLVAAQGMVALTLSAPSQQRTQQPVGQSAADSIRLQRDETVADVVAARRGLDVLEAYGRVDDERLGLLGFSLGGRLATLVAGVDERVQATILVSAGAAPVSEYVDAAPAELRDVVQEVLPAIDPLTYVGQISGSLFIQIGRTDSVVPQDALQNVVDAAPEGTRVVRYQADHGLDAKAERDRIDWLVEELELDR